MAEAATTHTEQVEIYIDKVASEPDIKGKYVEVPPIQATTTLYKATNRKVAKSIKCLIN